METLTSLLHGLTSNRSQEGGESWPTQTVYVLLITFVITLLAGNIAWRPSLPKSAPQFLKIYDWPIVGAIQWFSNREKFLAHGSRATKTGNFSFYLGKLQVVSFSGLEARKTFFESRDLNMAEGYATLYAASPGTPEKETNPEDRYDRWFGRTITAMMKKENFVKNLSPMVSDSQTALQKSLARVGPGGLIDPFDDIYKIVYQLTMRMVGPTEFAESPEMLDKTLHLFEVIESSLSPTRVVFPWLPTPGYLKQLFYGAKLYSALKTVIDDRKKTGRRIDDPLQYLMENGGGNIVRILTFITGSLFAGQLNSGISACWLLIFLAPDPYWYRKFQEEVDSAVKRHRTSPQQSPMDVLASLTVDQWEAEFPLIDLGLRETIRFSLVGAAIRKNVSGKEVPIGKTGEVVPVEGFAVYLVDDVHMNSDIYTDPERWDPGRYLPDRAEDKKHPLGYLGWGLARHPCLGMRFAKLEMAVIAASFISTFDYSLHNPDGTPLAQPYPIDRSRASAHKPAMPMRLKITPRKF